MAIFLRNFQGNEKSHYLRILYIDSFWPAGGKPAKLIIYYLIVLILP